MTPTGKRVAIVTSIGQSVVNFRASLIEMLVARGCEVLALAPDYDDRLRDRVRALGAIPVDFSLERTGMSPVRDVADFVRLYRLLRRLRPDAVLTTFMKPVIYGGLAAAMARVPRRIGMIEGLGYAFGKGVDEADERKRRRLRTLVQTLYRVALATTHKALFLNNDDLNLFVSQGLIRADSAANLDGIGVQLDRFTATPPPTDPVTFLLVARLLRDKGIGEFAEAARLLHADYPMARFILLGDRDANPACVTQVELNAWLAEGAIEWPGQVEDVRPWLAQSSVFVLPSHDREGVPRSTQEALASGRPVITTDIVGCRETVADGENGFLIQPRSAEALANAMRRFLDDPALLAPMGAASRRLAERRFDARQKDGLVADLLLG